MSRRLLAVDPSLTASGWALFEEGRLIGADVICPPGPSHFLAMRLARLQELVTELLGSLRLSSKDYLICEGPAPLVDNPQSALKVEHVRGIFEGVARARGVSVPGRLNPRTVQSEILGMRGKQLPRRAVKEHARETALRLFPREIGKLFPGRLPQDVVDAILIGTLAISRIKYAEQTKADLLSAFAGGASRRRRWGERNARWTESDLRRAQKISS